MTKKEIVEELSWIYELLDTEGLCERGMEAVSNLSDKIQEDLRKEAMKGDILKLVYEKWKHCDIALRERWTLPDDIRGTILYDLWQAVSGEMIKRREAKNARDKV